MPRPPLHINLRRLTVLSDRSRFRGLDRFGGVLRTSTGVIVVPEPYSRYKRYFQDQVESRTGESEELKRS